MIQRDPLWASGAVSSVAEELRRHGARVEAVPSSGLSHWLPDLALSAGWVVVPEGVISGAAARIALRYVSRDTPIWDGCEVISLYRVTGAVPEELVESSADRTLRDLDAYNVLRREVEHPPLAGLHAVCGNGWFTLGDRRMWGQFANYVFSGAHGTGLVEHSIFIAGLRRPRLAREVSAMTEAVYRSLITSLEVHRNMSS